MLRQGDRLTTNLHDILEAFGDTAGRRVEVQKEVHAMFAMLVKLLHDEGGATAIEYAMVASLVSIVGFFFISSIGNSVSAHFESVANAL
jgi:Flp pilus assembly pilin Flp